MNIEIKNRFNGNIIIVGEYDNIKDALLKNKGADLRGADLRGADLYGANLRSADLRSADLRGANLRGVDLRSAKNIKLPIISLSGSRHFLFYINGTIEIGCEKHTVEKWMSDYVIIGTNNGYSDSEIEEYFKYISTIANMIKENKNSHNGISF